MQLLFKAPKLIPTQWGYDISFSQAALHGEDGKFLRNLNINNELLEKIKRLEKPRQRFQEEVQEVNDKSPGDEVHELLWSGDSNLGNFLCKYICDGSPDGKVLYSLLESYLEQQGHSNPQAVIMKVI